MLRLVARKRENGIGLEVGAGRFSMGKMEIVMVKGCALQEITLLICGIGPYANKARKALAVVRILPIVRTSKTHIMVIVTFGFTLCLNTGCIP